MEQIQQISLGEIYPWEGNRRYGGFDETKLQELADSIRTAGVLQPAVVRERINGQGRYEIVAGERRWRAAKLAGLQVLPCVVRDLDDVTVLKIQTIENLQREDIHPLDEADGYARLIERAGYDVEHLAQEVGRSASYVYQRLKLRDLVDEAKQKLVDGELTASHAILIARLQVKQQKEALKWAFPNWRGGDVCSVRELDQWIHQRFYLDLQKTAFQKDDADLVPKVGPCTTCPKRTGFTPALFPEIEKQDFCLDPKCFAAKYNGILARRREALKNEEVVEVCKGWEPDHPEGALKHWEWEECRKKDEGSFRALIVTGTERGRLTWGRKTKHESYSRFDSPEEEAAWKEQRRQEELQRQTRQILSQKVIAKLVEHYEAMPAGSRISSERFLPFLLDDYVFDFVENEILQKYGLPTEDEDLLQKARALSPGQLEMFLIEYKLHEAAPGPW
jgi:ParB/RepB/Spo0J family partition protein